MSARSRAFPWFGERKPRPVLDLADIQLARTIRVQREIEDRTWPGYGYEILTDLKHHRWDYPPDSDR